MPKTVIVAMRVRNNNFARLLPSELIVKGFVYDDRMEITSPRRMMNGSRIQDLDILHVPSMHRNEVVSDAFGRLHYMGRRVSDIGHIMNSYAEFAAKPEFYSTDHHFSVILSNRSIAETSQLFAEKPQLSNEKQQLPHGNVETDWELNYFKDIVLW